MTDVVDTSTGARIIGPEAWGPDQGLVRGGTWQEIVGSRVGASCRTLYNVDLGRDSATEPLHHTAEAVYYVASGEAVVVEQLTSGPVRTPLDEGTMVHIHARSTYAIESATGARLLGGPCPGTTSVTAESAVDGAPPSARARVSMHRRADGDIVQVPFISRDARLVVWLGTSAVTANMNYVIMQPGERNREHVHDVSEDTIHILEGHGTAENVTTGEHLPFGPGDTVHIEIGYWHAVSANRGERIVSVGGPCPADLKMLQAAGVDVDALVARFGRP
jgi:quercetin dioxygenase-like cupin family protein